MMPTDGYGSQLSVAVATPKSPTSSHEKILRAGQVTTGDVLSTMVIVCTHDTELLDASVAVQIRVIVPVYPPHPFMLGVSA